MRQKKPPESAVRRAVEILGGTLATQLALRVNYWALRDWMRSGVVPKTRDAIALSEATGGRVSVRELAGLEPDPPPKRARFPKNGAMSDQAA